jgi:hypothetical protein
MVPFSSILSGKVTPPNGSQPFLEAVRKYSIESKQQGSLNTGAETTAAQK